MVDGFSLGDPSLTVLAVVLLLSLRGDIIDVKPDGLRASLHFSTWVCCLAGLLVHLPPITSWKLADTPSCECVNGVATVTSWFSDPVKTVAPHEGGPVLRGVCLLSS